MTAEERNNILLKIRKLLDLKESAEKIGNEGEAYAAAQGVHRLLLKYNLSMSDVPNFESGASVEINETEPVSYTDQYGYWKRDLMMILCQFNYCQGLIIGAAKMMTIVGEQQNVIIVKQLYEYLVSVFKRLAKKRFEDWALSAAKDVAEYGMGKDKWVPLDYLMDSIKKKRRKPS